MFIFSRANESTSEAVFRTIRTKLFFCFVSIGIVMLASDAACTLLQMSSQDDHFGLQSAVRLWPLCSHSGIFQQRMLLLFLQVCILMALSWWFANKSTAPVMHKHEQIRQFTQDAGHELATPVAVIRARLQIMEREGAGNSTSQHLQTLRDATDRMFGLIEDLRMLARTQNPQRYLQLSIIKLDSLVQAVVNELSPHFLCKQITVKTDGLEPATIVADKEALERVLINLLSNALRYGKTGGTVELQLSHESKFVVLSVIDNGPGIPEECLPLLFSRFYRANRSDTREHRATGLGLSIVKAIVEAHNGTIEIASSPGKGTRFITRFPKFPSNHPFALFTRLEANP